MKRFLILAIIAILASVTSNAQDYKSKNSRKDMYKVRKELLKEHKKVQELKADKEARKQAKQMAKEGWRVAPGAKTLEKQIELSYIYQDETEDDLLTPKYVWGDASSTASNYDAGKMQALELARANLVGNLEANITQLVENKRDNNQLEAGDAVSITKTLNSTKSFITQKIGRTIPVIECYKQLDNGNVIVRVQTFYSMETARKIAKQAMIEQLEKEGNELSKQLDELLGW